MKSYPNQLPNKRIIYSKETTDPKTYALIERKYLVYDVETKMKFLLFNLTHEAERNYRITPDSFSPAGNAIASLEGSTEFNEKKGIGAAALATYNNFLDKRKVVFSASNNQAIVFKSIFSSDGKKLSFTVVYQPEISDNEEVVYQIYIYDFVKQEKEVINEGRGEIGKSNILVPIAWTNDDKQLLLSDVYFSEGAALGCCLDKIFLINNDGTNLREIDAKNREMTVSPSGTLITSADGKERKIDTPGFAFTFNTTQLSVHDLRTGSISQIADDPKSVYRVHRWSPDGSKILYTRLIPNDGDTPETYKVLEEHYVYDVQENTASRIESSEEQIREWTRLETGVSWMFDDKEYNNGKLIVDGDVVDSGDLSIYFPGILF